MLELHDAEDRALSSKPPSLDRIDEEVQLYLGLKKGELTSSTRQRQISEGRKLFSLAARERGHSVKDISSYLGIDPAAVSAYAKRRESIVSHVADIVKKLDGNE